MMTRKPPQPLRVLLFVEGEEYTSGEGYRTTWYFSVNKILGWVIVAMIGALVWVVSAFEHQADIERDKFAAECSAENGDVYYLGQDVCVGKDGRIIWLDSQREN